MAGQTEYCFGHVLVRDVCYQRLPRTERVARHELTADWLDTVAADRDTDLAEVVAHHRYTAHEIARTLGLDAHRYAEPARDALHRAARRTYALHTLEFAAAYAGRALSLCDAHTDPLERLRIELLATEIAFYSGTETFLAGGGAEQLFTLAEELYSAGDRASAARAWTLRGQAAWLRADRVEALSCLDRAVELFDELPDGSDKAEAYLELGRLHMLNMEVEPGGAAASAAKDIADRLTLTELATNARITIAVTHYQSGDRNGLLELRSIVDFCREHGLLALRRALQNLAWAMREEGDWTGSEELLTEGLPTVPGGHNLRTGYSAVVQHSYFTGDWSSSGRCGRGGHRQPGRRVGPAGARHLRLGPAAPGLLGPGPGRGTARHRPPQRLPPAAVDRARPRRAVPGAAGPLHRGRGAAGRAVQGVARRPFTGQRRVDRRRGARRVPVRPVGGGDGP